MPLKWQRRGLYPFLLKCISYSLCRLSRWLLQPMIRLMTNRDNKPGAIGVVGHMIHVDLYVLACDDCSILFNQPTDMANETPQNLHVRPPNSNIILTRQQPVRTNMSTRTL
jgi:hypothetical protein